jgi:integrase
MSKIIDEWLAEFTAPQTKSTYKNRIEFFFKSTGLSPEKLSELSIDEIKHTLLVFRQEQLSKGTAQNGVLGAITAVRSLCIQFNKPIKFRKGQIGKTEADNDSHVFSNGDLKLLFDVGDTEDKAILATATSLGWEISSFLDLDREHISKVIDHAKQNNENFVFFSDTRSKTGEARLAVLNPLAIQWLTNYLATRKDSDTRLFPISQDGVQKLLYRLAQQSGLKTTGNLRFHAIRKWLMSRLSRANFNEYQIKFVLGKSIGVSDRTYLQTLQTEIEEKYPRLYDEFLNINPMVNTEQLKKLGSIEKEVEALKEDMKLQQFNDDYRFNALVSALEDKLHINIDASKLLAAHERKYSEQAEEHP